MAHEIILPTEEDTLVNLRVGDQKVTFDLMDFENLQLEVSKQLKELGVRDNNTYLELMVNAIDKTYGLKLSKTACSQLVYLIDDCMDEFKKKFGISVDFTDSTETSETPLQHSISSVSVTESP